MEVEPRLAQVRAFGILHQKIFRLRLVIRDERVREDLGDGEPFGTEEAHGGGFAGESVRLGSQEGIGDARDDRRPGIKSDEEGAVEPTLSKLSEAHDLFWVAKKRVGDDFEESGDVKDASTLSEAKGLVGTKHVTL